MSLSLNKIFKVQIFDEKVNQWLETSLVLNETNSCFFIYNNKFNFCDCQITKFKEFSYKNISKQNVLSISINISTLFTKKLYISFENLNQLNAISNLINRNNIFESLNFQENNFDRYINYNESIETNKFYDITSGIFNFNSGFDNNSNNFICNNINDNNNINLNENLKNFIKSIENYSFFIYDFYTFKILLKKNNIKDKKEIGIIYKNLKNDFFKKQILTLMITKMSKKHLKEKLKKITFENQDLIINNYIELFNDFLGNSNKSNILYEKILPGELNDIYGIEILFDLKGKINMSNLLVLMQNYHKIYFNDITNINFNNPFPFVQQDLTFITPYFDNIETNNKTIDDKTRTLLIPLIYESFDSKNYEICLNLCKFYLEKFYESYTFNYVIFNILSEIYRELYGYEEAKKLLNENLNLIKWLYPDDSCNGICDVYYQFCLVTMKLNKEYVDNNKNYIIDLINNAYKYNEKFYKENNLERYYRIKIILELFQLIFDFDIKIEENDLIDCIINNIKLFLNVNNEEGLKLKNYIINNIINNEYFSKEKQINYISKLKNLI